MLTAIEIFCCYAREDQILLQKLKNHLMPLQRQGLIQIWSDTNINAGDEWEKAIEQHLEAAEIILLLISADFMASEYCYSKEMHRAMQRHDEQSAHVIPIVLRRTFWKGAPFEKLQFLPTDAKPITDRSWSEDEALYDVVEQISNVVRELRIKNIIAEAQRFIAEGHPDEALTSCEQALVMEPEYAPALSAQGHALFLLGNYKESLAAFDHAIASDPLIVTAQLYERQAEALEHLQQYDEARVAYDLALQRDPQNIRLLTQQVRWTVREEIHTQSNSPLTAQQNTFNLMAVIPRVIAVTLFYGAVGFGLGFIPSAIISLSFSINPLFPASFIGLIIGISAGIASFERRQKLARR